MQDLSTLAPLLGVHIGQLGGQPLVPEDDLLLNTLRAHEEGRARSYRFYVARTYETECYKINRYGSS